VRAAYVCYLWELYGQTSKSGGNIIITHMHIQDSTYKISGLTFRGALNGLQVLRILIVLDILPLGPFPSIPLTMDIVLIT